MAIGVDTSKWKPRKLKGTPAATFSTYLGIGVLTVGILCGLVFQYTPATTRLRKATEDLCQDSIEEIERKMMIASGLPNRTADTIHKLIEESERPDLPHK